MQIRKYSKFHLIIKNKNELEILGTRKGLTPFLIEYSIKKSNNEIINKKFSLETPYIQSNFFYFKKDTMSGDIDKYIKIFNTNKDMNKEISFFVDWKPVEYLSHQHSWSLQAKITQNENKNGFIRIQGKMGQKKQRNFKKDINIGQNSIYLYDLFDEVIKIIIDLISSRSDEFSPELLLWLIK